MNKLSKIGMQGQICILVLFAFGCSDSRKERGSFLGDDSGGIFGSIGQDVSSDNDLDSTVSTKSKRGKGSDKLGSKSEKGDVVVSASVESAYEEHVLALASKNCGQCHSEEVSPFFASEDAGASANVVLSESKVNTVEPGKSRLVLRLREESHFC